MEHYSLAERREREIVTALLDLLERTPFEKVTVTDLAQVMGISRKCFYRYFANKEACLTALTDRFIMDMGRRVAAVRECPMRDRYVLNLTLCLEQRAFLEMIARNNLDTFFFQRHMHHLLTEERSRMTQLMETADLDFDEDVLFFSASGLMSLLMRWCRRGFDTPVEEMAAKFQRLFETPLVDPR